MAQGALLGVTDGSSGTANGYVPSGRALSFPSVCGHRFASVDAIAAVDAWLTAWDLQLSFRP